MNISTTSADTLVQQLAQRIDSNNDGQISKAEFAGFLNNLIAGLSSQPQTTTAAASTDAGTAPSAAADVPPSAWTDNNAPFGVTFAGFSPQDHTDLTLQDLGVPGKAEKYAAYDYLLSNKIQPTNDWAPAAADALNAQYNTTVYHAIDGETPGYGDEYIHSAANGYGMARGTFNPLSTGEFFWGNV